MKAILFFMLCIITVQSLVAQDMVTLKNGKVIGCKIISLSYGIKLLIAKDTVKYTVDEVASLMFCSSNKNCPDSDTNSNGGSRSVIIENKKDNPCNCIPKQNENADKIKPKTAKSKNSNH